MVQDEYIRETLVQFDLFACSIFHQEPHWGRCEPSATTGTADKEQRSERLIPEKTFIPESEKI